MLNKSRAKIKATITTIAMIERPSPILPGTNRHAANSKTVARASEIKIGLDKIESNIVDRSNRTVEIC